MIECAICGDTIKGDGLGVGHNPEPVSDGRCCSECNYELVVPARLTMALGIKVKEAHKIIKEVNDVDADRI